jgi:hypothetical protein
VEQATAGHERLGRALDVEDAAAGGHPLGVAVGDGAAAAVGVLVLEGAVDHVGHGLEAAVGMPGRAPGLARGVVDLTHLVHVDEGIDVGLGHAGEGPAHRKTLALVAGGSGGHRAHGADGGCLGHHQLGQGQNVVDGDGRHRCCSSQRSCRSIFNNIRPR